MVLVDLTKQMSLEDAQQIVGQVVENPEVSQELITGGALAVAVATILVRTGRLGMAHVQTVDVPE